MRIMVDMSATLIHHGHIRILKKAKELGTVIVALTTDEEILKKKGYSPVIQALALDNPDEYLNYERHSFNIEDAVGFGLNIENVNDAPLFWGIGAFTRPEVINLTIQTADEWVLWHYPDFKDLKDIAKILQSINGLPVATRLLDPDPNGIYMGEINKVT